MFLRARTVRVRLKMGGRQQVIMLGLTEKYF